MRTMFKKWIVVGILIAFIGTVFGGVAMNVLMPNASPSQQQSTLATTIYVDITNTGTEDGTAANPYNTIMEGINAASGGDTVSVKKGTYKEKVTISKAITLSGESKANTIVEKPGTGSGDVVKINQADGVTISGFTIKKSGAAVYDSGIKIYKSANAKVENCNISDNHYGIYIQICDKATIKNNILRSNSYSGITLASSSSCTFDNNMFYGCSFYIFGKKAHWTTHTINTNNKVNGKPIYFWKNKTSGTVPTGAGQVILAHCQNVIVKDQNCSDGSVGIMLGYTNDSKVENSICNSNTMYGVHIYNSQRNTIKKVTCKMNEYYGISSRESSYTKIIDNICTENKKEGIHFYYGDFVYINGNTIANNNIDGLYAMYIKECRFLNNNISNNDGDGILFYYGNGKNVLKGNTLISNKEAGIHLYFSASNELYSNTMSNCGLHIQENTKANWLSLTIPTNNTVNGKPIHFLKSKSNTAAPANAGQLILADCSKIDVKNQVYDNATTGSMVAYSSNINYENCAFKDNSIHGINIRHSPYTGLTNNQLIRNGMGSFTDNSHNSTIKGNSFNLNNKDGLLLGSSSDTKIENNIFNSNGEQGLYLYRTNRCAIKNNTCSNNNAEGIEIYFISKNNLIENNTVLNNKVAGIKVHNRCIGTKLIDNYVEGNPIGIHLYFTDKITVSENAITDNRRGIYIESANEAQITNNTVKSSILYAIELRRAHYTMLVDNTIGPNSIVGIHAYLADGNTLTRNSISKVYKYSIHYAGSKNLKLKGNIMQESGLYLWGSKLEEFNSHDIDTSNKVNGDPIVYVKNKNGYTVTGSPGQVILANSKNVNVKNINTSSAAYGIFLAFSDNNHIFNNDCFSNKDHGISLVFSDNNKVENNTCNKNKMYGIDIYASDNNKIYNNTLIDNSNSGIRIEGVTSTNNEIARNLIKDHVYGIFMMSTKKVLVYHNNFVSNNVQAKDYSPSTSDWHHPTLLEGNYWSDYTGKDDGSGSGKHATANDGIGDTKIPHPAGFDNYPLMKLWPNTPPEADANGPYTGSEGTAIVLNASKSSDADGDPLKYRWDFNNDGTWDTSYSTSPTVSHTWTDDYSGKAAVEVSDGMDTDKETADVTVSNVAPSINSITPGTVNEGSLYSNSGSFTDPGADTWTATVDYGDSSGTKALVLTAKTFVLSHVYKDSGSYSITIKVTDDDSGTGTYSYTLNVNNVAPSVNAGADKTINEGSAFISSGSFTDPGADSWTATVDYGDGEGTKSLSLTGKTFSLSHVYDDNGVYTVTVKVKDDDGGEGTDTVKVTVNNVAPTVNAGADATVNEGSTFSQSGSFSDPGDDTWTATVDYGDGVGTETLSLSGKTFSLSNVYDDNGVYTVTVKVKDDDGGEGTDTVKVTVNNVAPATNAGADASVDEGDTFSQSGSFTDPGDDTWTATVNYGDGGGTQPLSLSGKTFSLGHVYKNNGVYTITVRITDDDGGLGTDTVQVTVNNVAPSVTIINFTQPNPGFILPYDNLTFNGQYMDVGVLDTHTVEWDFGDGNTSTGTLTPVHAFGAKGNYTVTLKVTDNDGGIGTDTIVVHIGDAAAATDNIIEEIENLDLPDGLNESMTSKLENAKSQIEKGNNNTAANKLQSFINQVEAQRGKKLTDEEADALIAAAQAIIDNLVDEEKGKGKK